MKKIKDVVDVSSNQLRKNMGLFLIKIPQLFQRREKCDKTRQKPVSTLEGLADEIWIIRWVICLVKNLFQEENQASYFIKEMIWDEKPD